MRVATIDIGTNTVLLLVAETRGESLVAVDERATITRLGQGVDKTRTLAPDAIARTNTCLTEYADAIRAAKCDRVAVVGTSAMRDAKGGDEVRSHVRSVLGVDARVISGEEEARLTFAGAVSGLGLGAGEIAVFDIGGGSTEVVRGTLNERGEAESIAFARSFDVGSVRLTERHGAGDPPSASSLDAVRGDAVRAFEDVPPVPGREVIGIAGTMTTLAAVSLALEPYDGARVHGHVMERVELARVATELASCSLETRLRLPGLEPKRADVIVAGAIIALALLDRLGATRARISDRGVRWGLAESLARL